MLSWEAVIRAGVCAELGTVNRAVVCVELGTGNRAVVCVELGTGDRAVVCDELGTVNRAVLCVELGTGDRAVVCAYGSCYAATTYDNLSLFRDSPDSIENIKSMPGQARYGVNKVCDMLHPLVEKGLESVLLFGVPSNLQKVGIKTANLNQGSNQVKLFRLRNSTH